MTVGWVSLGTREMCTAMCASNVEELEREAEARDRVRRPVELDLVYIMI